MRVTTRANRIEIMRWGAVHGRRLLLSEEATEESVARFAAGTHAEKLSETTSSPNLGLSREVTWRVGPGYYLHYGREHPSGASFVFVAGDSPDDVDTLTDMLVEYFRPDELDDLLVAVDSSSTVEARRVALVRAGLGAPRDVDGRFYQRIVDAMHDENPRVREGGLWAAAYAPWQAFRREVEEMAASDDVPELRDQAEALAEALRRETRQAGPTS